MLPLSSNKHTIYILVHLLFNVTSIKPIPHRDTFLNRADQDQAALVRAA